MSDSLLLVDNFRLSEFKFAILNDKLLKILILCIDITFFVSSFLLVAYLRFKTFDANLVSSNFITGFFVSFLAFYVFDLYRLDDSIGGLRVPGRVFLSTISAIIIFSFIQYSFGEAGRGLLGRGVLIPSLCIYSVYSISFRFYLNKLLRKYRNKYLNWIFLGTEEEFEELKDEHGIENVAGNFFYLSERVGHSSSSRFKYIETSKKAEEILSESKWYGVIFSDKYLMSHSNLMSQLVDLKMKGKFVYEINGFYEQFLNKIPVGRMSNDWVAISSGFGILNNPIRSKVKRILDIILSTILFVISLPLMITVAILIKIEDRGPIFYTQKRSGLNNKDFRVIKFRSMSVSAEANGPQWAKVVDTRVTKIGKIIRLTRIDELPQVINVIKGEMSFIGPRPERPEFNVNLEKEIPFYNMRILVKPGITGWAQVLYPYGASKEDALHKLQYDLYYLKNYSLSLDFSIIIKTLRVVFFGKGR